MIQQKMNMWRGIGSIFQSEDVGLKVKKVSDEQLPAAGWQRGAVHITKR